jgi:hypothetical protein
MVVEQEPFRTFALSRERRMRPGALLHEVAEHDVGTHGRAQGVEDEEGRHEASREVGGVVRENRFEQGDQDQHDDVAEQPRQ